MILSISPKTTHGSPSFIELTAPSAQVAMRSVTGENIQNVYLGNGGITGKLPEGFAVRQRALSKNPWLFGKDLYLEIYSYRLQAKDGNSYNQQVESGKAFVLRAVRLGEDYFAYIVVAPSDDSKFSLKPLIRNL